jgi:hypothetical protein
VQSLNAAAIVAERGKNGHFIIVLTALHNARKKIFARLSLLLHPPRSGVAGH